MITEKAFSDSALKIDVEPEAIKAVAEVESSGDGFLPSGEVKILFEPHIFWRELIKRGVDPKTITGAEDILYQKWGAKPYGKNSVQHDRLNRAIKIDREAALASASYGKFQIMGFNYLLAGYDSVEAFVDAMKKDEDEHLFAFINFVHNKKLTIALREKNWEKFALGYNGSGYKKNNYHLKLPAAYQKFKSGL
jgi:hypothetical protein